METKSRNLRDPDALCTYVEQALQRSMPEGWQATFTAREGLQWRLESADSVGSLEHSFTVYAFTTPPTLVVTHGNSDAGARGPESMMLRRSTVIDLWLLEVMHVSFEELLRRVFAEEPDVNGLT